MKRLILVCSTGGATTWTFQPAHGNDYFLVVPRGGVSEGSYGKASGGIERDPAASSCMQQAVEECP